MKLSTLQYFLDDPSRLISYFRKRKFETLQNKLYTKLIKDRGRYAHCWDCGAIIDLANRYEVCIGLDPEFDYNEPLYDNFVPRFCPHCGKKFNNIEEFDKAIDYSFPEWFGIK